MKSKSSKGTSHVQKNRNLDVVVVLPNAMWSVQGCSET